MEWSSSNEQIGCNIFFNLYLWFFLFLLWLFYIQPNYAESFFISMTTARIEDLSKTLLQTTGILVSFITVTGFYFLGKMGNQLTELSSTYHLIMEKNINGANVSSKIRNLAIKTKSDLFVYCKDCTSQVKCTELSNQTKWLDEQIKTTTNYYNIYMKNHQNIEKGSILSKKTISKAEQKNMEIQDNSKYPAS